MVCCWKLNNTRSSVSLLYLTSKQFQQVIFNCPTFRLDICTKGGMQVCFTHALFVWRETECAHNNLLDKITALRHFNIQTHKTFVNQTHFTIWKLNMLEIPFPIVSRGLSVLLVSPTLNSCLAGDAFQIYFFLIFIIDLFFVAGRFAAQSKMFAVNMCSKISEMIRGYSTPLR